MTVLRHLNDIAGDKASNFTEWTPIGSPTVVLSARTIDGIPLALVGDDDPTVNEGFELLVPRRTAPRFASGIFARGTAPPSVPSQLLVDDPVSGATLLDAALAWNGDGSPAFTTSTGTLLGIDNLDGSNYRAFWRTASEGLRLVDASVERTRLTLRPANGIAHTGNLFAGEIELAGDLMPDRTRQNARRAVAFVNALVALSSATRDSFAVSAANWYTLAAASYAIHPLFMGPKAVQWADLPPTWWHASGVNGEIPPLLMSLSADLSTYLSLAHRRWWTEAQAAMYCHVADDARSQHVAAALYPYESSIPFASIDDNDAGTVYAGA